MTLSDHLRNLAALPKVRPDFGLLMTINLGIGYCTPPLGVSLYISGTIANKNLVYVSRAVMPFILIQIGILLLLTFFPSIVLLLPRLIYGTN